MKVETSPIYASLYMPGTNKIVINVIWGDSLDCVHEELASVFPT